MTRGSTSPRKRASGLAPQQRDEAAGLQWVPADGGHVTVRVIGFDPSRWAKPPRRDELGRIAVELVRHAPTDVRVVHDGLELGQLPAQWAASVQQEVLNIVIDGKVPMARATIGGLHGEELHVLLAYPAVRVR